MAGHITKDVVIPLSLQDELAPISYVRFFLCFPFRSSPSSVAQAVRAFAKAHGKVLKLWPQLTGGIEMAAADEDDGRKALRIPDLKSNYPRRFSIKHHTSTTFAFTFRRLETEGFPAAYFLGEALAPVSSLRVDTCAPAFATQINFIDGGIIIALYLHHSIADSRSLAELANVFGAKTRNDSTSTAPQPAVVPSSALEGTVVADSADYKELLKQCPEYYLFSEQSDTPEDQPAAVAAQSGIVAPLAVTIFVFRQERLDDLKALVRNAIARTGDSTAYVTTNDCLAALLWSFVTRARTLGHSSVAATQESRLVLPVDHRDKVTPRLAPNYFGNALSLSTTSRPVKDLIASCVDPLDVDSVRAFTQTALAVRRTVLAVDDEFVRRRLALSKALPDINRLEINMEPDKNWDMEYNAWATLGADSVWQIPGVPAEAGTKGTRPASVRGGQHESPVNGVALELPRRHDSREWEVVVQLRAHDMVRLSKDQGWLFWIDRMVGV